jgi:phage portal protein BeeE
MQILEYMDKAEEQIAKVYHYPLGLLNSKGEVANESINSRRLITDAVMPYIRRFDDADSQSVKMWYNDPTLQVITDLSYYTELQEDMQKVVQWLKDAYWLSTDEKRRVMDYEEEVRAGDTV